MKTLIIYYSRTGMTKKVAEALAEKLGAEIKEIGSKVNYKGVIGYLRAGREATLKIVPEILPLKSDLAAYDLVIVGTPVWAFTMASPVRAFLEKYKSQIKRAAFFRTQGGKGSDKTFKQMAEILGQTPTAALVLLTKEVVTGKFLDSVLRFVEQIKNIA